MMVHLPSRPQIETCLPHERKVIPNPDSFTPLKQEDLPSFLRDSLDFFVGLFYVVAAF